MMADSDEDASALVTLELSKIIQLMSAETCINIFRESVLHEALASSCGDEICEHISKWSMMGVMKAICGTS